MNSYSEFEDSTTCMSLVEPSYSTRYTHGLPMAICEDDNRATNLAAVQWLGAAKHQRSSSHTRQGWKGNFLGIT